MNPAIYKQPLIVFLGAGASVPLGMKTTVEFYEWLQSYSEIDYSFLGSIAQHIDQPSEEVNKRIDVEAILDFLERVIEAGKLLEKLGDAEHMRNILKKNEELLKQVHKVLPEVLQLRHTSICVRNLKQNIELHERIKDLVVSHYSEIDKDKAFELYNPIFQEFQNYPCPFHTLPVFTTNYDLAMEKAYEHPEAGFRLIDGFERKKRTTPEWSGRFYQEYKSPKNGLDVILFKLHGSVDWHLTPAGSIQRVEARQRDPGQLKTILIYPSRQKREIHVEPFRTSYDYLFACLAHAKTCLIIGFSFRDQEIVEELRAAIGINKNLKLGIIDPNANLVSEHLFKKLGFKSYMYLIKSEFSSKVMGELTENAEFGPEVFLVKPGL